jgi:hypothetical protein
MYPKSVLRIEGAVIAAVATAAYLTIGGPLWLFVVLALAPDVSMLAYLADPRVGSTVYNAFHTYLAPVTFGAAGVWLGITPFSWIVLIWAAHIGVDHAVGYGLKYPAGFKHTHLSGDPDPTTPARGPAEVVSEADGTGND